LREAITLSSLFRFRFFLLSLVLIAFALPGRCDESIGIITDSSGTITGSLPVLKRGDIRLVPLQTLSSSAGWEGDETDSGYIVHGGGETVVFGTSNPFAKVGGSLIQLRMAPELWDGSFWVPVSSLERLFRGRLALLPGDTTLILSPTALTIAASLSFGPKPKEPTPHVAAWTLKTIIIDPGHGGKDPGAPGPRGWKEKTITLDIAKRLASLIAKQGLTVKLTRDRDEFVSLQQRTHIANESHGDLFLSIHCNSNHDKTVHGVEAYFLKPARTKRAVDVAVRENSVVKYEGKDAQYSDLTEENYILLSMATSQNLKDSESLAAKISEQAVAHSKIGSRGVDQAGFYVLMGTVMPAVLVECGYLSNRADAQTLMSEHGRQSLAEALLNSILDMKTKLETSVSN
jgi:N-acetylmuramoyl-L-alanine amidase